MIPQKEETRGLKLTDQILKIAERITEKLIRQEVDSKHFYLQKLRFGESF